MRRLTALLLAAAMLLALSACGGTAEAPAESAVASSAEQAASAPAAPQAETPEAAPSAVPEESALEIPAEPEPEPEPEPTPEPNGPTIVSVTCRDTLVETAATETDWINSSSASSNIDSVTLSDGTVITAEEGGVLTLVVNGDQYDILDYVEQEKKLPEEGWSFETTAGTEEWSEFAKFMNMAGQTAQYTYRSALKVGADGIVEAETIPALLEKADYDASHISGGELSSYGPFFNGIIADSAPFTVENMTIRGEGDGANDFQGEGAMVLSQGTADVTVADSAILTKGVIRTAAAVRDSGILRCGSTAP